MAEIRISNWRAGLEPYGIVSVTPLIGRNTSIAIDTNDAVEDLGDRVGDALGHEAFRPGRGHGIGLDTMVRAFARKRAVVVGGR